MISYEYFMDRMADYELSLFLDNIDYAYVDEWEQTRLLIWTIVKTQAKKGWNKKPSDMFSLVTDADYNKHKTAAELDETEKNYVKNMFLLASKNMNE